MPLHEHIERLADSTPDRVVLSAGKHNLTACQVERLANRIARTLLDRDVSHEDVVAVALPRDITLIPALLGVLKTGAAYLPIDPHLPPARIRHMLEDSGARHVLVPSQAAREQPYAGRACLDPTDSATLHGDRTRPLVAAGEHDAAYVIYTSGTTGRPKGVVIEHRNVDNLAHGWAKAIPFPPGATMSSLATVAFDIFLAETFLPMLYGLRVALATDADVASPAAIAAYLARERVSVMQVTPSRLNWMLADRRVVQQLGAVELLIVGGETLPPPLLARVRQHTDAAIYNVYGPTEATVWTSAKLLTGPDSLSGSLPPDPITIGPPITDVTYHLADTDPDGFPDGLGELCIGGAAVARGYLGDPPGTSHRFHTDDVTGDRRYRTGDLARQLDNGELQVVGRVDQQIKIDGYRVELGEIEAHLAAVPGVREAVVVAIDPIDPIDSLNGYRGGRTLAGMMTPAHLDTDAVWARAAERLPRYMMPSTLVAVGHLPLSTAGKADRRAIEAALRDHLRHLGTGEVAVDPLTFLRATVGRWLGAPVDAPVDPDRGSLLDLGVGSLNTARLAVEIDCRYGVQIDLAEIITVPSLRRLAELIERRG